MELGQIREAGRLAESWAQGRRSVCCGPLRLGAAGWRVGHLARNADFLPTHTPVLRPLLATAGSGTHLNARLCALP